MTVSLTLTCSLSHSLFLSNTHIVSLIHSFRSRSLSISLSRCLSHSYILSSHAEFASGSSTRIVSLIHFLLLSYSLTPSLSFSLTPLTLVSPLKQYLSLTHTLRPSHSLSLSLVVSLTRGLSHSLLCLCTTWSLSVSLSPSLSLSLACSPPPHPFYVSRNISLTHCPSHWMLLSFSPSLIPFPSLSHCFSFSLTPSLSFSRVVSLMHFLSYSYSLSFLPHSLVIIPPLLTPSVSHAVSRSFTAPLIRRFSHAVAPSFSHSFSLSLFLCSLPHTCSHSPFLLVLSHTRGLSHARGLSHSFTLLLAVTSFSLSPTLAVSPTHSVSLSLSRSFISLTPPPHGCDGCLSPFLPLPHSLSLRHSIVSHTIVLSPSSHYFSLTHILASRLSLVVCLIHTLSYCLSLFPS